MSAGAVSDSVAGRTPGVGAKLLVLRPNSMDLSRELIERGTKTVAAMKDKREQEWTHWRECSQWIDPRRGEWLWTTRSDRGKLHGSIVNNRAFLASKTGAAGLMSGMTPRSRPWFRYTTIDPRLRKNREVKEWLREVEAIVREILDRSNFYPTLRVNYREIFNFGQGAFSIVPDFENVIHCRQHTIGSYYVDVNTKDEHDTFAEEFILTVGQMLERYSFDRLSLPAQEAAKKGEYQATCKVIRLIEPNRGEFYKPGRAGWQGMPFRVLEWEDGEGEKGRTGGLLSLTGEEEFPVVIPRWETLSGHPWASSWPGADALGDVKQIQSDEVTLALAKQHNSDPATVGPPEMEDQMGRDLPPGARLFQTELVGGQGIRRVFEVNPFVPEQAQDIARVESRVDSTYHRDVFKAITNFDRTGARVIQIDAMIREQMSELGPIVESVSNTQNDPALFRIFRIAERAGILPDVPGVLEGMPLRVDYISLLAQAQRSADIDNLDRWFIAAGNMQQVEPAARHRFNGDEWMKEYGDELMLPPKLVRTDKQVAELIEQDRQAAIAAERREAAESGARAAKDASQASLEGDTALGAAVDFARGVA